MTLTRLLVVAALVAVLVAGRWAYARWRRQLSDDPVAARLPAALVADADRTWVVFTTPYCASCEPVRTRLESFDPDARVVKVDATAEPALAREQRVRAAPTVLLAGRDGVVIERLVGAGAVNDFVAAHADRSYQA